MLLVLYADNQPLQTVWTKIRPNKVFEKKTGNKKYEQLPSRQREKGCFLLLTKHNVWATVNDYL